MKQSLFTIACIAAIALARHEGRDMRSTGRASAEEAKLRSQNAQFSEWIANHGRGYMSTAEYEQKRGNWVTNDNAINANNEKSRASGNPDALILKHNLRSDMSQEERLNSMGHRHAAEQSQQATTSHRGRGLEDESRRQLRSATNINWAEQGAVGPTYSQGSCGSCYAFAANRVLEGTIFAKHGYYERISEQHIVDCSTNNGGCQGGLMENVWDWQQINGSVRSSDYPYTSGSTQTEGTCVGASKPKISKQVTGRKMHENIVGQNAEMLDAIQDGPISIAVKAGTSEFDFYSSGVLTVDGCGGNFNFQQLNHGITLVGVGGLTEDPVNPDPVNPDPVNPDPVDPTPVDPTPTPAPGMTVVETMITRARKQLWADLQDYASGCRHADEELVDSRWCVTREVDIVTEDTGLQSGSRNNEAAHWVVLNSWGSSWGQNGLGKFAMTADSATMNGVSWGSPNSDAPGVCGLMLETQSVYVS